MREDPIEELRLENERLASKLTALEKLNLMSDDEVVLDLKTEIERLKDLCVRAAEALEEDQPLVHEPVPSLHDPIVREREALIRELREAVE